MDEGTAELLERARAQREWTARLLHDAEEAMESTAAMVARVETSLRRLVALRSAADAIKWGWGLNRRGP